MFILCPSEKSLTGLYCRAINGNFGLAIISISCMPCKMYWFFLTFRNDFGSSVYSSTCELSQKITTFFLWVWGPNYMGPDKCCTDKNWHGSTLCLHGTGGTWRIFEWPNVQVWDLKKQVPDLHTWPFKSLSSSTAPVQTQGGTMQVFVCTKICPARVNVAIYEHYVVCLENIHLCILHVDTCTWNLVCKMPTHSCNNRHRLSLVLRLLP